MNVTFPAEAISIASVSDAEPIAPPSSIISDAEVTPAVVTDKLPVDAPVNDPVPKRILSADSSYPMNTFASSPRSITIPASPDALPVLPLPSSINWSSMTVLVAEFVTVEPLTVRFAANVRYQMRQL